LKCLLRLCLLVNIRCDAVKAYSVQCELYEKHISWALHTFT
jgi:hypothetical protein